MDTDTTSNNVWTCKLEKYQRNTIIDRMWIDVKSIKTIENHIVLMMSLNSN